MKETFTGKIIGNEFVPDNRNEYIQFIKTLNGDVSVTIGESKLTRSEKQNRYYWSKVVGMISDELGYGKDEVHSLLGSMFLKNHVEIKENDVIKRYTVVMSTTSLDTDEMSEYMENCKRFASKELGIYIPD